MTFPSVSVALATYNGAKHLTQQLDDLAEQSRLPCELVVCDDDSEDDTLAIVQNFADAAPFPVHIHRNPVRVGYRRNFIQCVGLCSGDVVAFCDQDDRWSPQKLEIMAAQFLDPDTMLVFHNARVVSPAGVPGAKLRDGSEFKRWERMTGPPWMFSLGFTQVFRRSLAQFDELWPASVDQNSGRESLAHDQWYFFLASAIGAIVYVPDVLADYRQHEENTYGWRSLLSALSSRVADETKDPRQAIRRRLTAAEVRAAILRRAAEKADEPFRSRLLRGSAKYGEFAERYRLRAALYEGHGYRARARAFRQLLAAHAYGRDAWRIGALGLAMDCLFGLTGIGLSPSHSGDQP